MGLSRFELLTPRLSSVCSNQLSYRPQDIYSSHLSKTPTPPAGAEAGSLKTRQNVRASSREYQIDRFSSAFLPPLRLTARRRNVGGSRKEVIQPQVLLQLPCYDFTPITNHTLGACLPCGLARRLLVQPAFVM